MPFSIKRDVNDDLYSKIIRHGKNRCERCLRSRDLQCAHIMGRANKSTRWALKPVKNAVALCFSCHEWFDKHKIMACILEPKKRVFSPNDESFTFLVAQCGYTWEDLTNLYIQSRLPYKSYKIKKQMITSHLKDTLLGLMKGGE